MATFPFLSSLDQVRFPSPYPASAALAALPVLGTNNTKTQKTLPLNVNLNIQFGRVPWVPLIIERIPIRIQIENEYCDYGARWVA